MFEKALRNVRCAIWTSEFAAAWLVMQGYRPSPADVNELKQAETELTVRV